MGSIYIGYKIEFVRKLHCRNDSVFSKEIFSSSFSNEDVYVFTRFTKDNLIWWEMFAHTVINNKKHLDQFNELESAYKIFTREQKLKRILK